MGDIYSNKVNTYGLTEKQNELLKKRHTEFEFNDVSYNLGALFSYPAAAVILNFEKLSESEIRRLDEICYYTPLFIIASSVERVDLPAGFWFKICDISDKQSIAKWLNFAKQCRLA